MKIKIDKKNIPYLTGAALVFFAVLIAVKLARGGQKEINTATVAKKGLIQVVSASGEVKAEQKLTLKFQTSGLLSWVGVKEGDWVKKWQAVAKLDTYELERDLINELRDYSKERADFEEEYRVTYREQTPYTALTDTVRRILEKNQWDLDKAVTDVEIAHEAVKLATMITPIEGIVTHIDVPIAGVNITPATATFTIANPALMVFEAEIDEVDIGKIRLGQTASLTLDAYPEEAIAGEVAKIAFQSVATSGGGTAFLVEVILPENINQKFRVGMNGDLDIVVDQKENVLVVPSEAVRYENGQAFVAIWENKQSKTVRVTTGLETENNIEIIEGLNENQLVVIGETK